MSSINSKFTKQIQKLNVKSFENKSIYGASPPAVFVSHGTYPIVDAGPMVPPFLSGNDSMMLEDSKQLLKMSVQEIASKRSKLIRASVKVNIKQKIENPFILKSQELARSKKAVDIEVWFNKSFQTKPQFDDVLSSHGPSYELKNFDIIENPRVPKKIDYITYDTDALVKDAIFELWNAKISNEHIMRLLSIGLLGTEKKRTLVPTRWSITAIDDLIGKNLIKKILDFPEINEIEIFNGCVLGNHFEIILIPRSFSFELIEIWQTAGKPKIAFDWEFASGKKKYSNLAGGYYAARLGVLEYLQRNKRQAAIYIIREIRKEYFIPLGVWVVREGVRAALNNKSKTFGSIDGALSDASKRIYTPLNEWKHKNRLMKEIKCQKTFSNYIVK
ncbi:MAG: hypothetical protein HF967_04215 [Methanosarcinales archaeon]|nr:hypothetical protein [Methanosarcinales archaeon]